MSNPAELLPDNAGLFERTVSQTLEDSEIVAPLVQALRPETAPDTVLPFIAAHESVDLWFSDWSLARKRQVIANAMKDAALKGTRAGSVRYLSYVDGALVDALAYPARFVFHRAKIGRTPIGHQPFVARYLVRMDMQRERRSFVIGSSALKHDRLKTPSRKTFERALMALRVAKNAETQIRVDFRHQRMITLNDAVPLTSAFHISHYVERIKI